MPEGDEKYCFRRRSRSFGSPRDPSMLAGVMVAFPNISAETRDMMFKGKDLAINGAFELQTNKRFGRRIWPFNGQAQELPKNNDKARRPKSNERLPLQEIDQTPEQVAPNSRTLIRNNVPGREHRITADTNDPESFHCAIGPILGLAQVFGIFPVTGIRSPSPASLRFNKFSFRTGYATIVAVSILVMAILSVIHMIKTLNAETFEVHGGIAAATAGAIFYGNSFLGNLIFFWLSPRWVALQQDWRAMEQYVDSNKSVRPRLRWKFALISSVILLLALVEHLLSIANNATDYTWSIAENATFPIFLKIYCSASHKFILDILEYNFALGMFIFIVSKIATFTWNFTDVFVMLVSTGLAERYKTLNKKVMTFSQRHRVGVDWCELREDFATLSCIVKKVDNEISPIILLSFANNLYFICLQLLNGLSKPSNSSILSSIYFFGSFAFLIGRTCAVTLLTARINDQSKMALPFLYSCSGSSYNVEAQRLQYQLTTDDVALTGLRFFSITRNFMLAVAGAIVTYEVVLLQFNVAMKK